VRAQPRGVGSEGQITLERQVCLYEKEQGRLRLELCRQ